MTLPIPNNFLNFTKQGRRSRPLKVKRAKLGSLKVSCLFKDRADLVQ